MDVFIQYAIAASQFAVEDSGLVDHAGERARRGRVHRLGHRRFPHHRAMSTACSSSGGPRKISPFFIPAVDHQPGLGPGLDPVRRQGTEPGHLHGLLGIGARHRRLLRDHQARRRRCHDRGRIGGGDHADERRRLRRRCGRCRRATTSRRGPAVRSTRTATGSSSARAPACWSSRSSSTRRPAAPASTPRSSATACRATRITSPRRRRTATARSA